MPPSFVRPVLALAAVALAAHAALAAPSAPPPERRSTLDDQQSVAVTIYNEQLALIKDQRRVLLDAGTSRLALRDVSAQMQPQTALLRSLDASDAFQVLEQNFDFDLLSPAKLLEKSVGRSVRIVKTHPMRKRLRDRAAQRQGRSRHGDRARTRARRLDHAAGIAAPHEGSGRHGAVAGQRAGGRQPHAELPRADAVLMRY
jgi:hypothetical protein